MRGTLCDPLPQPSWVILPCPCRLAKSRLWPCAEDASIGALSSKTAAVRLLCAHTARAQECGFFNAGMTVPRETSCWWLHVCISCDALHCTDILQTCNSFLTLLQGSQETKLADRSALSAQCEPLLGVAEAHADGKEAFARSIATELFSDFLSVEERFAVNKEATEQEVIDQLRQVRETLSLQPAPACKLARF